MSITQLVVLGVFLLLPVLVMMITVMLIVLTPHPAQYRCYNRAKETQNSQSQGIQADEKRQNLRCLVEWRPGKVQWGIVVWALSLNRQLGADNSNNKQHGQKNRPRNIPQREMDRQGYPALVAVLNRSGLGMVQTGQNLLRVFLARLSRVA